MAYTTFRPGQMWLDDEGKPIQAHAGSLLYHEDTYYWYGEDKSHTLPGNGVRSWGIRLYSSHDLYNWHDEGLILPPNTEDPSDPLHPVRIVDRPHILYNRKTGKFVMWIKFAGTTEAPRNWDVQYMGIFAADNIHGPYEKVRCIQPCGMNSGDFDLVVNPSDQKAYIYFERPHTEIVCADLTEDYLDVTGMYSCHMPYGCPPYAREAPAFFRKGQDMYLLTSGTSGYLPNPSEMAHARLFHGPWEVLGDPCPEDAGKTSYDCQFASVFQHPVKKDVYIAVGDRWVPSLSECPLDKRPDLALYFEKFFSGQDMTGMTNPFDLFPAGGADAGYVWLPIVFEDGKPVIHWMDEWRWEDI